MDPSSDRSASRIRPVAVVALVAALAVVVTVVTVIVASLTGQSTPATTAAPPRFVEEAAAAGIEHAYDGEFTYFVGGGVAVFDCDADGLADLYFAGGAIPSALYRNRSEIAGALRFEPVPAASTDLESVTGAYPLDVDADGHLDLAVLRIGEDALLRGQGDCRFERANEAWGFESDEEWTVGFSATWEPDALLPTLAIGNYLELDETGAATGACADNLLFRPEAGRTRYATPIALTPGWCTLSVLFSDWDRSGRRDLRMTNDRHYYRDGEEQLWNVTPGATPRLYTREDGWEEMEIWGMGIASHDLTGDGYPEVVLTSQGDNKLQTLAGGASRPTYRDIAIRRGVTAHRPFTGGESLPSTAWHPEFRDVNNDGWMDLFITKGNVEAQEGFATRDPSNLLLGQPDGTFEEAADAAGIVSFARGRGGAVVDLNLDGMLDIVKVNRRENVELWRNVGWGEADAPRPMGHWLALRLEQTAPDRDAIGSWIEVRSGGRLTERELTIGGGHAGGQLGWIHFGLGTADRADVRVRWPDGELGPWQSVVGDSFAVVERGAQDVRAWTPVP